MNLTEPAELTDQDLLGRFLRVASAGVGVPPELTDELEKRLQERTPTETPEQTEELQQKTHYELLDLVMTCAGGGSGLAGNRYLQELKRRMDWPGVGAQRNPSRP